MVKNQMTAVLCQSLKSLTTFLHESEEVIEELFTLPIIVQLVQLKQRERRSIPPEKIGRLQTRLFHLLPTSGWKRLLINQQHQSGWSGQWSLCTRSPRFRGLVSDPVSTKQAGFDRLI